MEEINCYICGSNQQDVIHKGVRDKEDINVLKCSNCGLVFLSDFSHIDNQFYEDSNMHQKNFNIHEYLIESSSDDIRRFNYLEEKMKNKTVLDFGCGAGGFLSRASTVAKECEGIELDAFVRTFVKESGIACYKSLQEIAGKKYDIITMFHVLEHIADPKSLLLEIKKYLKPNGILIIEVPNSEDALITLYENEAFKKFTYWSCHLILYNDSTLTNLLQQVGFSRYTIKQIQRYPLSNHLFWLSQGLPGGHKELSVLNEVELNNRYADALASIGKCDTIIAEVRSR